MTDAGVVSGAQLPGCGVQLCPSLAPQPREVFLGFPCLVVPIGNMGISTVVEAVLSHSSPAEGCVWSKPRAGGGYR